MKWKVKVNLNLDKNDLRDLKGIENCVLVGNVSLDKNEKLESVDGIQNIKFRIIDLTDRYDTVRSYRYHFFISKYFVLEQKIQKLFNDELDISFTDNKRVVCYRIKKYTIRNEDDE